MALKRAILVLLKVLPSLSSNTRTYEIPCTLKLSFSFYSQVPILWYIPLALFVEYSLTLWTPERKGPQCLLWVFLLPLAEPHPRAQGLFFPERISKCRAHNQPAGSRPLYIIERRAFRGGRWALRVKTMHVKLFHPSPKHSRGSWGVKQADTCFKKKCINLHKLNLITGLVTWAH